MRTVCPGLCVLRFKYLAAPTKRTTVTAVGTHLPNHCLHRAIWSYFLNRFISSLLCCVPVHFYLKSLILRGSDACYLSRLSFFQMVSLHGLEHPRGIVDRRVTEFVKVRKSPEDLLRVIGRGLCDLSSRTIR